MELLSTRIHSVDIPIFRFRITRDIFEDIGDDRIIYNSLVGDGSKIRESERIYREGIGSLFLFVSLEIDLESIHITLSLRIPCIDDIRGI